MKSQALADPVSPVRQGEDLPLDNLRQHLEPVLGKAKAGSLQVKQFPGGFSNLTYLLSCSKDNDGSDGDSGDNAEQWVLRRPPFGSKVKTAHDMSREYRILSALNGIFPQAPTPIHFCSDHAVMGCDFYLMAYVRGMVIRQDYPPGLNLSPDEVHKQLCSFFDVLGDLHAVDLQQAGLADFGKPAGYVDRQIDGWCRRWQNAITPDTCDFDGVMDWLQTNRPSDSGRATVIHNDYKMDNVIFSLQDPMQVIGVLDWEMATVGDPLMDLGCTLGYWVQQSDPAFFRDCRTMPSDSDGAPSRAEIVARFQQRSGISVDNFPFYFCFGLFRLAVIGQQIYYRYYHGLTKDKRFKAMVDKAQRLQRMCDMVITGEVAC